MVAGGGPRLVAKWLDPVGTRQKRWIEGYFFYFVFGSFGMHRRWKDRLEEEG